MGVAEGTVGDPDPFPCFAPICHPVMQFQWDSNRAATNPENLENSGISLNMENSGNSQGILCNLREKL